MREFLGASIRSFSGRIIGAASALAAAYSVTTNLSVSESGLFFLGLGFAIFFSHFLRFGLDNFVLKKCAIFLSEQNNRDFLSIITICCLVCVSGSAIIYMILNASASVFTYEYMHYLILAFPAAMAIALLGIVAHSLHASGFVFTGSFTDTSLHYIVFSVFTWLLDPADAAEAIGLFTVACYSALIAQVIAALVLFRHRGIDFSEWKNARMMGVDYQEMLRTTLPLWMVVIAQQLSQWGGQFISSSYVPAAELALLAIAMRIAMLVPMILTAVNMVVSPRFAAHFHKGEIEKTEDVLAQSLKLLGSISIIVFISMILFGDDVLEVFGERYVEAGSLLTILVCGQLVNALTGPIGKLLIMTGHERDVRNSTVVVAALGIVLSFYMISNHGVYGAAISTALTISAQNIALAVLVNYRFGLNLLRIYARFIRKA